MPVFQIYLFFILVVFVYGKVLLECNNGIMNIMCFWLLSEKCSEVKTTMSCFLVISQIINSNSIQMHCRSCSYLEMVSIFIAECNLAIINFVIRKSVVVIAGILYWVRVFVSRKPLHLVTTLDDIAFRSLVNFDYS